MIRWKSGLRRKTKDSMDGNGSASGHGKAVALPYHQIPPNLTLHEDSQNKRVMGFVMASFLWAFYEGRFGVFGSKQGAFHNGSPVVTNDRVDVDKTCPYTGSSRLSTLPDLFVNVHLKWGTEPSVRTNCVLCLVSCVLCLFLAFSPAFANESLRIAGMGGAFVGFYNTEGAIFGNPAGLISIQDNNLSLALSAQDMYYEGLPSGEGEQLNTMISFRLRPSVYYSRVIKGVGVSLGYVDDLDNRSSIFKVGETLAEYSVDERKLTTETNTVLEYDFFRDKAGILSLGYPIKPEVAVGLRLKYRQRSDKVGTIYRPLRLSAVHGEEVNRNDATKLLPAIMDNLDIADAVDKFKAGEDSYEEVVTDLSGGGLDMDLGVQAKISETGNISVGFMLDHLIQRRIINAQPSSIRIGIGAVPTDWLVAGFDLQKVLADGGLNVNLGWEVHYEWQRWFSGGITIRNGFTHESSKDKLSVGIGLTLGGSHWDYTLVKPLDGSHIGRATHMFSSTTRF